MGKPSKNVKYSATYCWIRWTNLYPVPGPGPSCPGNNANKILQSSCSKLCTIVPNQP